MKRSDIEAMKFNVAKQISAIEDELKCAEEEVRMYESDLGKLDDALEKLNDMEADDDNNN